MLLTFLDRLLMFRPLAADSKDSSKGQFGDTLEVPQISLSETPNGVDPTRKAVKYVKSPQKRSPSPNLFPEQQIDWRQYLVHHHSGCSCQFCRWPQYKCAALLVLAGYARVAFLSGNDEQCHQLYSALSEFWAQRKNCFEADELLGQREDFLAMMARAFMNYGQLLMKNVVLESARREFRKSLEIVQSIGVGADPALVQDIEMNLQALEDAAKFVPNNKPSGAPSFAEFIKQNAHLEPAPAIRTNKFLLKTPKVGPSRVIPKTATRADDLLKQVARKRLKTVLAENNHSHETELISAMTGLSCGSERRPKTKVSIFVDSPEKPASGRLQTGKKKLFCKETYSAEQETSPKKPARERNLASETPAAAPKLTRKKRLPLSPTLHASSSTESFKDALVNGLQCSTPKVSTVATRAKGRTTSKKPKLNIEYPKLGRAKSKSPKQNHSFNSSFRDVLLKSITESAKQRPPTADSSVIVLDDSDEVVNTSIVENTSINHSCGGVLSLKKYSDRKVYGSTRKKITAKTRLQFDSSVVDITTPVSSPVVAVAPTPASGSSSAETVQVVKRTRGRPKVVKTTEITPELGAAVPGKITRTTRKVRGKAGAV
uniref:Putative conserved secreted protein n=1 Tax=Culex tarsalis TaxID=7177 RepID=A0A1Q3F4R5_CULTA